MTTTPAATAAGAASIAYQLAMATEYDGTVVLNTDPFTDVYADVESALIGRELASGHIVSHQTVRIRATFDSHGVRAHLAGVTFPKDAGLVTAVVIVRSPFAIDERTRIPVISQLKDQISMVAEDAGSCGVCISDWIIIFDPEDAA